MPLTERDEQILTSMETDSVTHEGEQLQKKRFKRLRSYLRRVPDRALDVDFVQPVRRYNSPDMYRFLIKAQTGAQDAWRFWDEVSEHVQSGMDEDELMRFVTSYLSANPEFLIYNEQFNEELIRMLPGGTDVAIDDWIDGYKEYTWPHAMQAIYMGEPVPEPYFITAGQGDDAVNFIYDELQRNMQSGVTSLEEEALDFVNELRELDPEVDALFNRARIDAVTPQGRLEIHEDRGGFFRATRWHVQRVHDRNRTAEIISTHLTRSDAQEALTRLLAEQANPAFTVWHEVRFADSPDASWQNGRLLWPSRVPPQHINARSAVRRAEPQTGTIERVTGVLISNGTGVDIGAGNGTYIEGDLLYDGETNTYRVYTSQGWLEIRGQRGNDEVTQNVFNALEPIMYANNLMRSAADINEIEQLTVLKTSGEVHRLSGDAIRRAARGQLNPGSNFQGNIGRAGVFPGYADLSDPEVRRQFLPNGTPASHEPNPDDAAERELMKFYAGRMDQFVLCEFKLNPDVDDNVFDGLYGEQHYFQVKNIRYRKSNSQGITQGFTTRLELVPVFDDHKAKGIEIRSVDISDVEFVRDISAVEMADIKKKRVPRRRIELDD